MLRETRRIFAGTVTGLKQPEKRVLSIFAFSIGVDTVERSSVNTSVDVMCGLSDLIITQNFLESDWTVARFEKDVLAVLSLETMSFCKVWYLIHQSLHYKDLK